MVTITQTLTSLLDFYNSISEGSQLFMRILLFTILMAFYAIMVWNFYRFIAKRDILELDLRQYKGRFKSFQRLIASLFFLLEYIVIIPILVMLWFSIFSVFILVLSEIEMMSQIMLISAAIVATIRLTSYYSEDLSKDLAKMFPFTLLVIFLLNPGFFSLQKIITRIISIPSLLNEILIYFLFIVILELLMRIGYIGWEFFSTYGVARKKREDEED